MMETWLLQEIEGASRRLAEAASLPGKSYCSGRLTALREALMRYRKEKSLNEAVENPR